MTTAGEDQPVVVFAGAYQDCVFLFSALTGSGIDAAIDSPFGGGGWPARPMPRVMVRKRDVERALPLVRDFEENGKRAED